MLMVGSVGVNRVRFVLICKTIRTMQQIVFHSPGGFEVTTKPYFFLYAREQDKTLARRVIARERFPSSKSFFVVFRATRCLPSYMA